MPRPSLARHSAARKMPRRSRAEHSPRPSEAAAACRVAQRAGERLAREPASQRIVWYASKSPTVFACHLPPCRGESPSPVSRRPIVRRDNPAARSSRARRALARSLASGTSRRPCRRHPYGGSPPMYSPRARLCCSAALVRSAMISRSNAASTASVRNVILPAAVVVSIRSERLTTRKRAATAAAQRRTRLDARRCLSGPW